MTRQVSENAYDVIVIGSGMGGMATATALSRMDRKVLLLEQAAEIGGLTHSFSRDGFTWDVGIHYCGTFGPDQSCDKMLDWLSGDAIEFRSVGTVYDTLHFPDGFDISVGRPEETYKTELKERFPDSAAEIDAWFEALASGEETLFTVCGERSMPEPFSVAHRWWNKEKIQRWVGRTTSEVLEDCVSDPKLAAVLAAQWGTYGGLPDKASFGVHATIMRHYLAGAGYPVGGASAIAAGLVPVIEAAGGKAQAGTPVTEILLEDGRATGVRTRDGQTYSAPVIVSAIGAGETVSRLLPPEVAQQEWATEISALEPSVCYFEVYLGFEGDATGGDGDGDGDGDALPPRRVIYQLVVRHFGNQNQTRATNGSITENGVGKFADINEAAIAGLKELGINHVWLTGIPRQATMTDYSELGMPPDDPDIVKGRAGSFYAIRDYYDVCPDYALDPTTRLEEFTELVERLHAAELQVMIDLVPNHVARSYASVVAPEADFGVHDDQGVFFAADNNYFYLPGQSLSLTRPAHYNPAGLSFDGLFTPEDGAEGRTPKVTGNNQTSAAPTETDWYETIKLNWGYDFSESVGVYEPIPDTWTKMDAIVAYWQEQGVDGFRVDFAHLVPHPAWTWLIDQAKARDPEVFFLAEAYEDLNGLLDAGFDAVYHDESYDQLKRIYQGAATQAAYAEMMLGLDDERRPRYAQYLENHDERRIASPLVLSGNPDDSGFGSMSAGYQLGPLAYLYSNGPILFYNGQEVGEDGGGVEGFGQEDGRTSIFDYWSLPRLSQWVNGGEFDGGGLDQDALSLRAYYADLLALAQDPAARGGAYWGLEYLNHPDSFADSPYAFYSFARFAPSGGRVMVVVANFAPGETASGVIRLPTELLEAAGLPLDANVEVRRVLDRDGADDAVVTTLPGAELASDGVFIEVGDQSAQVFLVTAL